MAPESSIMEPSEDVQTNSFTAANILASKLFELPAISPDPSYDDRGNTKMAWTEGLFGIVNFVEWTDFHKVWGEGMAFLNTISEQERQNASSVIKSVQMLVKSDEAEDKKIRQPGRGVKRTRNVRRIWNNSASISGHARILIDAIGLLLRNSLGPHRDSYSLNIEKEASVSSEMITNDTGEKLHFSIPQNLKSDAAVVLGDLSADDRMERTGIDKRVIKSVPLCHFELKGPTLELAGVKQVEKVRTEMKGRYDEVTREQTTDTPPNTKGDTGVTDGVESGSVAGETEKDLPTGNTSDSNRVEEEGTAPCEEGSSSPSGENRPHVYTAKQVAETFNFLFSDLAFMDTRNPLGGPIRDSILRVSQAVVSAVFSYGGCAFIYNLESGIGFRVSKAENGGLTVEVTGVMLSDGIPNNGSAMYAIAKHCIDRFLANQEGSVSEFRNRAITLGTNFGLQENLSMDSSHEEYQIPDSQNSEDEDVNFSGSKATDSGGSSDGIDTAIMSYFSRDLEVGIDTKCVFANRPSSHAKRRNICQKNRLVNAKTFKSATERAIMAMFMSNEGIVGIGASGVVLTGYFARKKVAIKTAFDNYRSGSIMLQREIGIYNLLHNKGSPLLGSVVPNMILGWNKPVLNSMYDGMVFLVTEYVGCALRRDMCGKLWIGERAGGFSELERADEYLICSSALEGLRRMYEHGIVHGDISLDNLRAERNTGNNGTKWKTWWIDLGLARRVSSHMPEREARMFRIDVLELCALFERTNCADLASCYCALPNKALGGVKNFANGNAQ